MPLPYAMLQICMTAIAIWLNRVGKRRVAAGAAGVLVLGALGGWATMHPAGEQPPMPMAAAADPPAPATVLVFVSGAVEHPGLYQLSPDARVSDAIAAAGGISTAADAGRLPDLASRVHDGRQVNIPFARSGAAAAARLDINAAAPDELDAVPGMPPGLAQAIVEYRDTWGPFQSLSQLRTDLGVDSATVSGLTHYLRVVLASP
ncbi:MAG: ComEA family DNA-binding protein [Chloroflexi bacterium]|nr:MAG: ComEA family DNA-binding protein [Chloroflexota bacterium]